LFKKKVICYLNVPFTCCINKNTKEESDRVSEVGTVYSEKRPVPLRKRK